MVHGKNKGRISSKKKKKAGKSQRSVSVVSSLTEDSKPQQTPFQSVYRRYKPATKRFVLFLQENTPIIDSMEQATSNSILKASEWVVDHRKNLPQRVFRDLETAITYRQKAQEQMGSEAEAGHQHFIDVLLFSWSVLKVLPRTSRIVRGEDDGTKKPEASIECEEKKEEGCFSENRFAVFEEEEGDEEGEGDNDFVPPEHPLPRPEPIETPKSFHQIMEEDAFRDVIFLLRLMDTEMKLCADYFKRVVELRNRLQSDELISDALIEPLMIASTSTNLAIQNVKAVETEIALEYPHLSNPYRMLAMLPRVCPTSVLEELQELIQLHGHKQARPTDIYGLIGDCLRAYFFVDSFNEAQKVLNAFFHSFQVEDSIGRSEIELLVEWLNIRVRQEAPIVREKEAFSLLYLDCEQSYPYDPEKDHSWMNPEWKHIGGDRSIVHTIRLLHFFAEKSREYTMVTFDKGSIGQEFSPEHASKTHTDMDDLLIREILQPWGKICGWGILSEKIFNGEAMLAPMFSMFRDFSNKPEKPFSWAFAFGVHAMLTSVLETKSIDSELQETTKHVFTNYFSSGKKACEDYKVNGTFKPWDAMKNELMSFQYLSKPTIQEADHTDSDRGLWNPFSAGTMLSCFCLSGNVMLGTCLANLHLRFALHLCNALKQNELLKLGDSPQLDFFFRRFETSKQIWPGGTLPVRGKLTQRFFMSLGSSISRAQGIADYAKTGNPNNRKSRPRAASAGYMGFGDFSSFFFELCADASKPTMSGASEGLYAKKLEVQTSFGAYRQKIVDAIAKDRKLMSINFLWWSALLHELFEEVLKVVGFRPDPGKSRLRIPSEKMAFFAINFLSTVDSPENAISTPLALKVLDCTKAWFQRIDETKAGVFFRCLSRNFEIGDVVKSMGLPHQDCNDRWGVIQALPEGDGGHYGVLLDGESLPVPILGENLVYTLRSPSL